MSSPIVPADWSNITQSTNKGVWGKWIHGLPKYNACLKLGLDSIAQTDKLIHNGGITDEDCKINLITSQVTPSLYTCPDGRICLLGPLVWKPNIFG